MVTVTSKSRSGGAVFRSISPSGRFYNPPCNAVMSSSSSSFASSTNSSFKAPSSTFFSNNHDLHHNHHSHNINHRSASPTRVNLYTSANRTQSVRFSIDNRSISPSRSIAVSKPKNQPVSATRRRCMCAPTTHPGSFRCSLHKNVANPHGQNTAACSSNRLNMRRSAMTNSLVRIGGVEGEWVRRALTTLIRPSSHQQRRRAAFQPRSSRLSLMCKTVDP